MGRYLRNDPLGIEEEINLYAYVANNPVNWIDPYGLEKDKDGGWRFDRDDHGGPHYQRGSDRYDVKTLEPIKHKGKTPPKLSKSQLKKLKKTKAWRKGQRFLRGLRGGFIFGPMGTSTLEAACWNDPSNCPLLCE